MTGTGARGFHYRRDTVQCDRARTRVGLPSSCQIVGCLFQRHCLHMSRISTERTPESWGMEVSRYCHHRRNPDGAVDRIVLYGGTHACALTWMRVFGFPSTRVSLHGARKPEVMIEATPTLCELPRILQILRRRIAFRAPAGTCFAPTSESSLLAPSIGNLSRSFVGPCVGPQAFSAN